MMTKTQEKLSFFGQPDCGQNAQRCGDGHPVLPEKAFLRAVYMCGQTFHGLVLSRCNMEKLAQQFLDRFY